ncbi:hypothetical protein [Tenacibaculum agarivorans]|uniref:hypothetical protein n=1 Tax=Tenacibaculum agarivorans TaxID=1908389 RepID=UPI00094BC502|nr:hypothetical protein [Tenacibaculum agarivorans]
MNYLNLNSSDKDLSVVFLEQPISIFYNEIGKEIYCDLVFIQNSNELKDLFYVVSKSISIILVSKLLKNILKEFKLPKHQFVPFPLLHNNQIYTYYLYYSIEVSENIHLREIEPSFEVIQTPSLYEMVGDNDSNYDIIKYNESVFLSKGLFYRLKDEKIQF